MGLELWLPFYLENKSGAFVPHENLAVENDQLKTEEIW